MMPIVIDPAKVRIGLVGRGELAERRLRQLLDGGAGTIAVFSDEPSPVLAELAGDRLVRRLPVEDDWRTLHVAWVVDLDPETAERQAAAARAAGTLVNVEDVRHLCDFHTPSVVRRGDLVLSVSTGGKSPGLAVRVRRYLETLFGPEWATRLDTLSEHRNGWRREGKRLGDVAQLTDTYIDGQGWLQ